MDAFISPTPSEATPFTSVQMPTTTTQNAVVSCSCVASLSNSLHQLSSGVGLRKQYTLASFLEEVDLRQHEKPRSPQDWQRMTRGRSFIGYISVLITQLSLLDLYKKGQLYCAVCEACGRNTFANTPVIDHVCPFGKTLSHSTERINVKSDRCEAGDRSCKQLQLSWNPRILSGFSDETGGLLLGGQYDDHGLQLTEQAIRGLTGLQKNSIEQIQDGISKCEYDPPLVEHVPEETASECEKVSSYLRWIEEQTSWARVTLVVGWSSCGSCERANMDSGHSNTEHTAPGGNQKIVVLDVLG